ncbi:MAG TPA: galactokinase [Anaerolineae bacterium]|nr:galactokinase [Anaerolineae bacterium]
MKNHARIRSSFEQHYGHPPEWIARAPGRINLLGEHVDYNDGWVLPAAIDRCARLAFSASTTSEIMLYAADLEANVRFDLNALDDKLDCDGNPLPGWALYPAGVAWVLRQNHLPISGLQAVLTSQIPIGSGLSSSAAIEVIFAVAWQALSPWQQTPMELAQICQRAENEYVGVQCGLMDPFSILHGVRDHALFFDTRTLDWEPVPLPAHVSLVVADSGVRRRLGGSAYNQRREACEQALRLLAKRLPGVHALRDVSLDDFREHEQALPPSLRPIAEHVVGECVRVLRAADLLKAEDAKGFGALMLEGHASLRDLYQVSSPELDTLVEIARELPGCLGARLTGAGFGGCTVNLVEAQTAETFIERLSSAYAQRTGGKADVWISRPVDGANLLLHGQRKPV